jgi:DNA-binding GntR family transcriptional regulator
MFVSQIFWVIGIHGNQMIKPIREPILLAAIAENTDAFEAGKQASNITKEILGRSLYDYLQGDLGIVFGDNRQTVRAVKPDENDKQYLQCSNEDPVLEVSKVMFLERGTPLEYSVVHHRYDMVEMSFVNVSRDGLLG